MISWNVRGLSSAHKRAQIKLVIFAYCPDFVILTETKLSNVTKKIIKSLWSSISIKWIFLKSNGRCGGIIIMWDDLRHSIHNTISGKFSVSIKICYQDGTSWWLSAIYGLVKRKNRSIFWEELENLKAICLSSWILGGDFNVVRWNGETSAKNPASFSMRKFNMFINMLIDPPLTNAKFTWSNLRAQAALSRLNRFLYSPEWERSFSCHYTKTLSRITSDHFPIILECSSLKWGPSPSGSLMLFLMRGSFRKIWNYGGPIHINLDLLDTPLCEDSRN